MLSRVLTHLLVEEGCPYVTAWFEHQFGELIHATAHDKYVYFVYNRGGQRKSVNIQTPALLLAMQKASDRAKGCSALWSCSIFYDEDWELDHKLHDFVETELGSRADVDLPFIISRGSLTVALPWSKDIPHSTDSVSVAPEDGGIRVSLPLDSPVVVQTLVDDLRRKL